MRIGPRDLRRRLGYELGPRLMSELRKRWIVFRNPHAEIRFGRGAYVGPGFSLFIPQRGALIVGEDVEFRRDFRAEIWGHGRLVIGAGTVFTYGVIVQCTTSIEIGERCMFGQTTLVVDGNHRFRDLTRPMLEQGYEFEPIRIGDDATITTKCTIISQVGERAFVGANSVVTKPVPAFTLVAGVPARPIEYFGPPGGEPEALREPASER